MNFNTDANNRGLGKDQPDAGPRNLLRMTGVGIAAVSSGSTILSASNIHAQEAAADWDKVFPRSEKVDHQKVSFKNRYGITLSADVYVPKGRNGQKLAAIVVGVPFGAVKEKSWGLYAQTTAERGFATLAFDPSFTGESGGEPRNIASPGINKEDFGEAFDYIDLRSEVDRERIGVIGVCGWGGMALNAVAVDKRVEAVVASTKYDMTRVMSKAYNDSVTLEQRTQTLDQLSRQRWADAQHEAPTYQPPYNVLKGGDAKFRVDYREYQMTPRGYRKRAVNSGNAWSQTTPLSLMNMPILTYFAERSPRPVLFVHGEKAHSRYFGETAFAAAAEPKEIMVIPGASHTIYTKRSSSFPSTSSSPFSASISARHPLQFHSPRRPPDLPRHDRAAFLMVCSRHAAPMTDEPRRPPHLRGVAAK